MLSSSLEKSAVQEPVRFGSGRFVQAHGRRAKAGQEVLFVIQSIHLGVPFRVHRCAAFRHRHGRRLVELGVVDHAQSVTLLDRDQRSEPLVPADLVRNVGCPDLDQRSGSLDGSLEDDDDFEVLGQHLFRGHLPEGTEGVDLVGDRDGPEEEDETVRVARLGLDTQRILTERDRLALGRLPVLHKQGPYRRPDDVRSAHVSHPEQEVVIAITLAYGGVPAKHYRLNRKTRIMTDSGVFRGGIGWAMSHFGKTNFTIGKNRKTWFAPSPFPCVTILWPAKIGSSL